MKLNNLWRTILEDWPIKVISLLLATSLYLVINYATLDNRRVEIPLQVKIPVGYEATSTIPDSVMLHIKAEERFIGMINSSAITAVADFSTITSEGVATVPILIHAEASFIDIQVSLSTDPETIKVFFRKTERLQEDSENQISGGIDL
jgi:YbbR domain-containing protein